MTRTRALATAIVCFAAGLETSFGQAPEEPAPATADASLDELFNTGLEANFEQAIVAEPLARDDGFYEPLERPAAFYVHEGVYMASYVGYSTIDGDFDGTMGLTNPALPDIIWVPDLDAGYSLGVGLGFRFDDFAFEFHYERAAHDDATLAGLPLGDAVLNTFNFDFKYFFNHGEQLQPHILAGCVIPWLVVDNGSTAIATGQIGDGDFVGVGLNIGGGVTYYLMPKVALTATAGYRFMWFLTAQGVTGGRSPISGNLDGSGFFGYAGVSVAF